MMLLLKPFLKSITFKTSAELYLQFLLDYYGPHIYDRYTTRFDSYPMERPLQQPPFGLKATTAKDYYGLKRGFESFTLEDVGAKILSFISEADKLYNKPKN